MIRIWFHGLCDGLSLWFMVYATIYRYGLWFMRRFIARVYGLRDGFSPWFFLVYVMVYGLCDVGFAVMV